MEKMKIKRTINGIEHEFTLTEEEINQILNAKQLAGDIEACDDFLKAENSLRNLLNVHLDCQDKDYGDFLIVMAKCYRELEGEGEPDAFKDSFWKAFSKYEKHVDVAGNTYDVEDMFWYGYTCPEMLPINGAAARELYGKITIYALFNDESEDEVTAKDNTEDGYVMFGVLKEDWEKIVHKDDLPVLL